MYFFFSSFFEALPFLSPKDLGLLLHGWTPSPHPVGPALGLRLPLESFLFFNHVSLS